VIRQLPVPRGGRADPQTPDDGAIIEEVAAGNREAYALIVRRYQDTLFHFAFSMVGSADAASDLVQESFVKAYVTLAQCREPARFGAWIHRILRNRCLDHLKRNRRQDSLDEVTVQLVREPDAEDALERRDLRAALSDALGALPAAQREAFLMKHLEDRSYEEMAEMLGASVSALKMRVKRAREAMLSHLENVKSVTHDPR
jgi:RNA polymerase sigma-70 factor (ECF subfamily)